MSPTSQRLGYVASHGVYAGPTQANGVKVKLVSGLARVYAGAPGASSHRQLAALSAGQSYVISGVVTGEVVSVQTTTSFSYQVIPPGMEPPPPTTTTTTAPPTTTTTAPPTTTTTTAPTTTTTVPPAPPEVVSGSSVMVTSLCVGSPCPLGPSFDWPMLAWPAWTAPSTQWLGYQTSHGVYLSAAQAAGVRVSVLSGSAKVFAGLPGSSSLRHLATVTTGQSYVVSGVQPGEVVSVESPDSATSFDYEITPPDEPIEPEPPCSDPVTCEVVDSVTGHWQCDIPGCTSSDWVTDMVNWPSWAAYPNNIRTGHNSRTVHSADGGLLYPYMGTWADGCEVTAVSGIVLIVEWQRGADVWRQTWLDPGESHVINLTSPEDNALIESYDFAPPFRVALDNCEPQPIHD